MVISPLKFDLETSRSRISLLVTELNKIESSLDNVARDIDKHTQPLNDAEINHSQKYIKLIDCEKELSEQWSATFETLVNFAPVTHKETSDAMVALVDLQLKGHNSEKLMMALRNLALDFNSGR